jgi:hypothetical protein
VVGRGLPSPTLGRAAREGVLILFAAYLLFLVFLVAARDEARDRRLLERRGGLVRGATAALAAVIAAGAALRLQHVVDDPALVWAQDRWAFVIPASVAVGGMLYVATSILGQGTVLIGFRWAAWLLMTVPLLVPSTFSLALPLVAPLAMTLTSLPLGSPDRRGEPAARR